MKRSREEQLGRQNFVSNTLMWRRDSPLSSHQPSLPELNKIKRRNVKYSNPPVCIILYLDSFIKGEIGFKFNLNSGMWLFILKLGTTNNNKYQANQVIELKKSCNKEASVVLTWDWYIWCGVRFCVKYDSNILFYYDSLFTYCRNKEPLYYWQSGSENNRKNSIIWTIVL